MKKIILGRGEDCDVYIDDPKGLISRKHAIIKINSFGGTEITDVSKNGTFINGIRIKPHIPHKIRRKDIVVFANTSKLDWSDIPDNSRIIKNSALVFVILITIVISILLIFNHTNTQSSKEKVNEALPAIERTYQDEQELIADPQRTGIETAQDPYTDSSDKTSVKNSNIPSKKNSVKKRKKNEEPEENEPVVNTEENPENTSENGTVSQKNNPGGD